MTDGGPQRVGSNASLFLLNTPGVNSGPLSVTVDEKKVASSPNAGVEILAYPRATFAELMANIHAAPVEHSPAGPASLFEMRERIIRAQAPGFASANQILAGILFPKADSKKALDAYSSASPRKTTGRGIFDRDRTDITA